MNIPIPGPGESLEVLEMTDERKEKWARAVADVLSLLRRTLTPLEAYAVLDMAQQYIRETQGIKCATRISEQQNGNS